ncbi:MAG: hypothetical protein KGL39_16215 [Patescibacteria group bacterium]|nr:hypothetical protein [Patescibacteria group bacterium]
MSLALYLDSDFVASCATTSGWGDFRDWAAGIQNAPRLAELCADGTTDNAAELLIELTYLRQKWAPEDPDVADVLGGIVDSLQDANLDADDPPVVIVSDGLGDIPDADVENDPDTIAADKRAADALLAAGGSDDADDYDLADDPDPEAEDDDEGESAALKKNVAKNSLGSGPERDDIRKQYIATWLKTHGERETALSTAMLDLQRRQADAVADALAASYDDNSLKATTASHIARNIFEPQGWVGKLKEAARRPLLYAWLSGASNELSAFGLAPEALPPPADAAANQKASRRKDADLGFDFDVDLPDDVKDGISAGIEKSLSQPYWGWIEATKRDDLQAFLEQALDDGKPMTEIVKDVRAVFDGAIGKDRALTIARTETTGALNGGAHEAQKHLADEGVIDGKEWLDTADARTRATHLTAGGQTVGVNDKFIVGGYAADYPGDAALPAKERVHCRCATTSVTSFAGRSGEPDAPPATISPAAPTPAPKPKPTPQSGAIVFHRRGTSEEFKKTVDAAVKRINISVRRQIAKENGRIISAPTVVSVFPDLENVRPRGWSAGSTWKNVDGACRNGVTAVVAETRESRDGLGTIVKAAESRIRKTALHELGHVWDSLVAKLSSDPSFIATHTSDTMALTALQKAEQRYFIQPGEAGQREAVAEAFAIAHDPERADSDFAKAFPNVIKAVKEKLGMTP